MFSGDRMVANGRLARWDILIGSRSRWPLCPRAADFEMRGKESIALRAGRLFERVFPGSWWRRQRHYLYGFQLGKDFSNPLRYTYAWWTTTIIFTKDFKPPEVDGDGRWLKWWRLKAALTWSSGGAPPRLASESTGTPLPICCVMRRMSLAGHLSVIVRLRMVYEWITSCSNSWYKSTKLQRKVKSWVPFSPTPIYVPFRIPFGPAPGLHVSPFLPRRCNLNVRIPFPLSSARSCSPRNTGCNLRWYLRCLTSIHLCACSLWYNTNITCICVPFACGSCVTVLYFGGCF